MVEVLNMSVQEHVMKGMVMGEFMCCIILVLKWYGFQLLCIAYDTYFVSLEVTSVFQNMSLQVVQHDM